MVPHTEESENESVLKITGIGCCVKKCEVESWLKENAVNYKELHLGLREGDKKTVKAFVVVDNKGDADNLFKLNESTFCYKNIHVYLTERRQLDRMLEVTSLKDCTVRVMSLPPMITKVDIEQFFEGLDITPNGAFIPARTPKSGCEAYVQFTNKNDTEKALSKHGDKLLGMRVIITRSSVKQRELAEIRTAHQLNTSSSPEKRKRKVQGTQTTVSQVEENLSSEKMLKLTGLGLESTTCDVIDWLKEDDIEAEHVLFFSKPSGNVSCLIAYVLVNDENDVEKGLKKDGQFMMNRYITVFRVTDPELQSIKVLSRVISVSNLPDNTSEKGLFNFFSGYGITVTKTMISDGVYKDAYIEFQSPKSAEEALKKDGTMYGYRPISVYLSLVKELSDLMPKDNDEEENESEEDESAVKIEPNMLKLSGLKKKTTEEKIWEWFTEDDMRVASVNRQNNGVAYVTLENEDDIEAALSKNNTKLKNRVIQVTLAKDDKKETSPKKKSSIESFGYIRMTGVSYRITEKEIRDFFGGLEISKKGVFLERKPNGHLTGKAMIQFATPEAAVQAIKKHRQYLGDRYVLLSPAKPEDWTAATSEGKEVKALSVVRPQSRNVPDGSALYKLSGLPWTVARKEIIDYFSEAGVELKEVFLGWKDLSSGIAYVAVDKDDGVKVQRKHQDMMNGRMITVFPADKLEFLSTMQLVESQDHFAVLRGVANEVSAKEIVEFFNGLEIEDCGIYALPDYGDVNEVVVQFKGEDAREEALKRDRGYIGARYARIFKCKMKLLHLLSTSTRVEDMESTDALFPHLVAMRSASKGQFQRRNGMEMKDGGGRPFEREKNGGSFTGFGKTPGKSESTPWRKSGSSFTPNAPTDTTPSFLKEERKRKSSVMEEERKESRSTKKKRKRVSEGDTAVDGDVSFTENSIVDKKCVLENPAMISEEVPVISASTEQELRESPAKKKKKKRKSRLADTSFAESTKQQEEKTLVQEEEKQETPALKQGRKKRKSESKTPQRPVEMENDKSADVAMMIAEDFFKKGSGDFKKMAELMKGDDSKATESTPDQGSKKKKRRKSIGFVEEDRAAGPADEMDNSLHENSSGSPKKKKKRQLAEEAAVEDHLEPSSAKKKKKKHRKT